eukprot:scaffold13136_cov63-Phaeocystis_antarctica.AAC.3
MLAERAQSKEVAVHDEGRMEELDAENEDDCDVQLQPLLQRHGGHRVDLPQEGDQRVVYCCGVEHRARTLFHLDAALIKSKGLVVHLLSRPHRVLPGAIVRLNGFGCLCFLRLPVEEIETERLDAIFALNILVQTLLELRLNRLLHQEHLTKRNAHGDAYDEAAQRRADRPIPDGGHVVRDVVLRGNERENALSDHEEHELVDPVDDEPMIRGCHSPFDAQPAVSEKEQQERPLQLFGQEVQIPRPQQSRRYVVGQNAMPIFRARARACA